MRPSLPAPSLIIALSAVTVFGCGGRPRLSARSPIRAAALLPVRGKLPERCCRASASPGVIRRVPRVALALFVWGDPGARRRV